MGHCRLGCSPRLEQRGDICVKLIGTNGEDPTAEFLYHGGQVPCARFLVLGLAPRTYLRPRITDALLSLGQGEEGEGWVR